ncbi:Integrase catalytic core [Arabidopsis thaliana x Arabidopsis arenosa]|uniref:Integrase catalytic core n=1 Tax=Arabidopsis thaliana x Arabidopsis arenosa TaxID=1240361 RepID=A0A8T1ZLP9_9BRAS|nr:Integrase catalytic core [Arabidopsis thaliana x Arabidopsis arenosa]
MENTKIRAPVTLKGGNYLLWARTMKTILCGRGFWPHIIKSEAPRETTTNEDGLEIVLVDEDKWFKKTKWSYPSFKTRLKHQSLKDTPIFRSLWAELEMLRPNTLDPAVINERREQDKVFGLLFTLNPGYNDLIKHLLRADKLQNLEEVCSQIQKEQGSLGLFGSKGELVSGNSSELASANRGNFNTNRGKAPWCDHCKRSGHAKEKCWILHPHLKPARREPRANQATGGNLGGQEQAGTSSQALGGNGAAMMASSDLVRRSDLDALIKALKESSGNAYHALSSLKPLIVDSGASHHMISDSKLMKNIEPALGNVIIANGDKIPVKGLGDLELFSKKSKAFYMPTFTSNLLSVKKATTDLNCYAIFGPNDVHFQDIETSRVLGHGGTKDGLYVLEDTKLSTPLASHFSSVLVYANNAIWHARLGHPHSRALGLLLPSISFKNDECEACILGKHCKSVFPKSNTIYENCFDLVHSDVWTSPCLSRENQKYFVTFIDEKSKYTWLTLLPSKDRVLEAFTNFQNYVTNHYNAKIKIFRSDNGGEYTSHAFKQHLAKHGIIHQTSCPYTPQQNGVAERKNRHLMEVARSMMFHTNVPKRFWSDAVVLACYLINRIPTKILQDSSPFEVNKGISLNLRVSRACLLDTQSLKKDTSAIYRKQRKVLVSRDVKFVESKGYYEDKNWEDIQDLTHSPSDRANNLRIILERLGVTLDSSNYEEAIQHQVWRDAIAAERQAMEHNHTWEEGELPRGKKAVTSKWVFTIKYKSNGDIERYKARLVARGFTQTYGEDYRDTFAPVAKLIRLEWFYPLATNLEWELWQMDVKNAFLQGELEEEVYMKPPPGLEDHNAPGKVFKLKKAIYGLKQSPRAWYHKLSTTLLDRGFKKSEADNTLFTLPSKEGIVVILVYVDDIIISGNDKVGIQETKAFLKSVFDIKDLGELKYFLGIEVCRSKEGLFLSQRKYTLDLLSQVGKLGAKPAKTPLEDDYKANRKGELDNKPFEDVTQYRRLVGKLIYLTITRPDICFAVNVVSQHMQAPTLHHWNMVTRILKYLKGAPGQGIWMGCNKNTELVGYCDADYAGDTKDRRSTTGYCTFIGGNLVTWRSKKQKVVSLSSAEAEYRAMRKLTTELMWLKALLKDFGIDTPKPITMHCDNQAAIHIASIQCSMKRTKHIEVDCHKIRAPVTLKGGNYLLWARTMKTILCGRGFWPHIIKSEAPRETTTNEEGLEIVLVDEDKWFQEDQMVLSVLQNSLEASILEGYSYCETPKDLWETLQNVFGNQSNLSRVFEIKKAINELTQGDMEFTQHFGKFRSLWAELEMLRPNTLDPAVINERREQDKVFGLLFTLNPGYNDLIKHLLRADKLQNLEEVCSQIQKEQGSLGLFCSKGELVSGNSSELASANRGNFNTNRGKAPWCDHCKKSGHAKEKCWILHPHLRPARREPRANHATGENLGGQEQAGTSSQALGGNGAAMMASSDLVRRSDLDALIKALKESSGNAYHALSSLKPLIVDSGASHHMISDSKLMKNIEPALGNVIIANGDKIPVKGLGDLELFSKKSKAFYMHTFTSNLLSVKRGTTDLNCYAIFGPNDVHFLYIETSRVLGHGGTKDGLYVLEDTKLSTPLASHFSSVLVNANNAIWHARLGHPHSRALGLLLPSISFKNDECEACILGEQRSKLHPKSVKGMFIGYSITQKGYKCYIPETKKVLVSRDVKFVESKGYYEDKNWEDIQDLTHSPSDRANNLRIILERLGVSNSQGHTNSPNPNPEPTQQQETSQHEEEEHLQEEENIQANIQENILEEGEIPSDHEEETTLSEEENLSTPDHNEGSTSQEAPIALRRSERLKFPPSNWKNTRVYYNSQAVAHPIQAVCTIAHFPEEHQVFLGQIDQHWIPQTYEEAIQHQVWRDAIAAERQAMEHNHTWEEVELPRGKKAVTSKWVFTIKYKSNGDIERYKARLVARGFTQTYGEDYRDTFAPVAKLHTVRVVLSLATNLEWELWQMDVKNAFLQGELEEEVYMKPPPGLEDHNAPGKVFKLKKAIYGLKQSPRAWYHKLSTTLLDRGFKKSEADNTLFTLPSKEGIVVILVYVDDIIISGNDKVGIQETKAFLKSVFDIKDLGELKYFLGIEVCRSKEGLFLSQRKYTLDLLSQVGKLGAKPAKTPLEDDYKANRKGELDNKPFEDVTQYRRLVGKLIYLTITRPDICFAVNVVSQHMQAPTLHHWNMVTRILKYLKGAPGQGIWMGCNKNTELVGYCDADYAGDTKDRRSTTDYCTFIGGNLVTWRSKKQKVVSLSSAEAEYRAMRKLTTELMWLKALLKDFGIDTPKPITMHCDNQAAIHIASNSVFHERTKHIEVDCHKVREQVQLGVILPCYTESEEQLADIFTKGASTKVCEYIHHKLGLVDLSRP